jgi:hypothetical protein
MNNPISDNWYADPESRVYDGVVYIYVTNSLEFDEQKNLDLITTDDLQTFTVHSPQENTGSPSAFSPWSNGPR